MGQQLCWIKATASSGFMNRTYVSKYWPKVVFLISIFGIFLSHRYDVNWYFLKKRSNMFDDVSKNNVFGTICRLMSDIKHWRGNSSRVVKGTAKWSYNNKINKFVNYHLLITINFFCHYLKLWDTTCTPGCLWHCKGMRSGVAKLFNTTKHK